MNILQLLKYLRRLPEGDKSYDAQHAIQIDDLQVLWDTKFPIISGKCNHCEASISGTKINQKRCSECNHPFTIKGLENKWIFAKFDCIDVETQHKFTAMSSHIFGEKILGKITANKITNMKQYIQCSKEELFDITNNLQHIKTQAKIIVQRLSNNNFTQQFNIRIDIV